MNMIEKLYLSKKLADDLGVKNFVVRLHQQDERPPGGSRGTQWLGQSIESLADSDAVLVAGANLHKEQPPLTARLHRAAKDRMVLSVLASSKEELFMPLLSRETAHPDKWAGRLKSLSADAEYAATVSLKNAEKTTVVLGVEVQNHPDYAAIYAIAQELTDATGAVLGILPQTTNSVGVDVLGMSSGESVAEAANASEQTVVLLNVELKISTVDDAKAVAALKQTKGMMAFTPFVSETLLDVRDILLPIAPFTEASGNFINMEGRLQSFHGMVRGSGGSRPLWKMLRVLGNLFDLKGFGYHDIVSILKDALNAENLPSKLNNRSIWTGEGVQAVSNHLVRAGGVGIYHTNPIVRRSVLLQETSHAAVLAARVSPSTLAHLGLQDGQTIVAKQNGASISVAVEAGADLPENVVYLPLRVKDAALGALMDTIELAEV